MSQSQRLPMALTGYSLPHVMGYLPTKNGDLAPPFSLLHLFDAAREMGLAGVEFGLPLKRNPNAAASDPPMAGWNFPSASESDPETVNLETIRHALQERDLHPVLDLPVLVNVPLSFLRETVDAAAYLGAKTVRFILSTLLCGDRRGFEGGWQNRLEQTAAVLREILPYAHEHGVCLAAENHQDATTDDLFHLADMVKNHPAFGITLDTGNPLSVGEDPVEAAQRLAPLIRHVHCKDYTIHFAPEGYRLVRCVAGQGCIDFAAILSAVAANGHDVLPGIEVAAQATRTIPCLDPGWWACYPDPSINRFLGALRVLWRHGIPADTPYSSAWERGEDSASVCTEEWEVTRRSAAYFQTLFSR